MRLALADIPKSFARRDGRVYLAPRLLRPHDLRAELAALIALYEASLGARRSDFPDDRPAELIGDYRLARSLSICLGEWYEWQGVAWPGVASAAGASALAQRDIGSPTALRLALYDAVQASSGGYLPSAEREAQLTAFAASLGVARATLDALLALDDPREARLRRIAEAPPDATTLAARYNQRAVEALLMSASQVEWRVPPEAAEGSGAGLGAVVKRVCFLARQMGVSYDVAFEEDAGDLEMPDAEPSASSEPSLALVAERRAHYIQPGPRSLDAAARAVIITLSGPQELMGAPNQYGERLARLCRALLGYRRAGGASGAALGGALSGWATVYLRGSRFIFTLDDRLLRLLRAETLAESNAERDALALAADPAFDSLLERRLYEDFTALERAGEAAGWRLEREPEPLLVGQTILVPDFALTRDQRRVYLEVAGYWRPGYRERKARKLLALAGTVALVVAAPEAARVAFGALEQRYPFLWYRDETLSAPALVALLLRAYDDFPARLAALDTQALLAEVARRGRIGAVEAQAALHSFTRAEVAAAVSALATRAVGAGLAAPEWLEGLGLCSADWLTRVATAAHDAVAAADGRLPLDTLGRALAPMFGEAAMTETPPEATLEVLAARARLVISRASLFAAEALTPERAATLDAPDPAHFHAAAPTPERHGRISRRAQPRTGVRRTHSGVTWSAPTMFPSEVAGDERPADPPAPPQTDEY